MENTIMVNTRKDFIDMINDIRATTKKHMWINLELNDLIGDAKNVEEATKNTLFELAEIITLRFGVNSEYSMKSLFRKYYKNLNTEEIFKETEEYKASNFPVQVPETKEEMIIKINELKWYCKNYCFLDSTHYRMDDFSTTYIVARMKIKDIEKEISV